METRKITIANSRDQRKHVIETDATTLGQLKRALDAEGINYDGMDFIEALSKTQLRGDDSVLPHDVPYQHTTTNELVFLLTVPNRKIKSGTSREEIYDYIIEHGLEEVAREYFGKDYTMVMTTDLESFVNDRAASEICAANNCNTEDLPIEDRVAALEQTVKKYHEVFMEILDVLDQDYFIDGIYEILTKNVKPQDNTVYSAGMSGDQIDNLVNSIE